MVWYMLKTLFVCIPLNVLVFTTCIQYRANLVVLHVLLLPCRVFLISSWQLFHLFKWPPLRFCIFLFLLIHLNAIVGLLTNTLRNSGLICRMCQFFLTTSNMFESVWDTYALCCSDLV